jgi:putative transposase
VVVIEESYTSKRSFLDTEPIGMRARSAGQRVKRGVFRSASGMLPDALPNGSAGCRLRPEPLRFPDRRQDKRKRRARRTVSASWLL